VELVVFGMRSTWAMSRLVRRKFPLVMRLMAATASAAV
jgi:hypothetical protein